MSKKTFKKPAEKGPEPTQETGASLEELTALSRKEFDKLDSSAFKHLSDDDKWKVVESWRVTMPPQKEVYAKLEELGVAGGEHLKHTLVQQLEDFLVHNHKLDKPEKIKPVLVVGATGTGKTFTLDMLLDKVLDNPIYHAVGLGTLTPTGTVGPGLEDTGAELVNKADKVVRARYEKVFGKPLPINKYAPSGNYDAPENTNARDRASDLAIKIAETYGVLFLDEFDKIRITPGMPEQQISSKTSVQENVMQLTGGDTPYKASTHEGVLPEKERPEYAGKFMSTKSLFIAAGGAFHGKTVRDDLIRKKNELLNPAKLGIKGELMGRLSGTPEVVDSFFGFNDNVSDNTQEVAMYRNVIKSKLKNKFKLLSLRMDIDHVDYNDKFLDGMANIVYKNNSSNDYRNFKGMRETDTVTNAFLDHVTDLQHAPNMFKMADEDGKKVLKLTERDLRPFRLQDAKTRKLAEQAIIDNVNGTSKPIDNTAEPQSAAAQEQSNAELQQGLSDLRPFVQNESILKLMDQAIKGDMKPQAGKKQFSAIEVLTNITEQGQSFLDKILNSGGKDSGKGR